MSLLPKYRPNMTKQERDAMDAYYERVLRLVIDKVRYLPEEHKAEIRRALEEQQ